MYSSKKAGEQTSLSIASYEDFFRLVVSFPKIKFLKMREKK